MLVKVEGGTDAGKRSVKQAEPWSCKCIDLFFGAFGWTNRRHPGWRYSCSVCGERRPSYEDH